MVSLHMAGTYVLLYYLWPKVLKHKKYFSFAGQVFALFGFLFLAGYIMTNLLFPLLDLLFHPNVDRARTNILWASTDRGLLSATKIMLIALVIKLLKYWWIKEKEKESLERQKIKAELKLLKAQIRPDFLFNTLDSICSQCESMSAKAPGMLIKLSDLLSYMLYDCDSPTVRLEKEIQMLKAYIDLEKVRQGDQLDVTVRVNAGSNALMITPLILLPFVDHSLSWCNHEDAEQSWISVEVVVEDDLFSMKLINGLPQDRSYHETSLEDVKKRLLLLYPNRHELKISVGREMLMVHLKLQLTRQGEQHHQLVAQLQLSS